VINQKTNRLEIDTFSAMQSVELSSRHTTSLKQYHRKDIQKNPVDASLIYHMQTTSGRYKRKLEAAMKEKEAHSMQKG
jgi:hypothetical protein